MKPHTMLSQKNARLITESSTHPPQVTKKVSATAVSKMLSVSEAKRRTLEQSMCLRVHHFTIGVRHARSYLVQDVLHVHCEDLAPILFVLVQHHLVPRFLPPSKICSLCRTEPLAEPRHFVQYAEAFLPICLRRVIGGVVAKHFWCIR